MLLLLLLLLLLLWINLRNKRIFYEIMGKAKSYEKIFIKLLETFFIKFWENLGRYLIKFWGKPRKMSKKSEELSNKISENFK